jgi:hypothetical protein
VWFYPAGDAMVGIQAADALSAERLFRLLAAVPAATGSPVAAATAAS